MPAPPATPRAILVAMPTENPFQYPLRFERQVPECVVVVFGATDRTPRAGRVD